MLASPVPFVVLGRRSVSFGGGTSDRGGAAPAGRIGELGLGAGDSIAVGERIMQRQRAGEIGARRLEQRHSRRAERGRLNLVSAKRDAVAAEDDRAVASNRPALFGLRTPGGGGRGADLSAGLPPATGAMAPSTRVSNTSASARTTSAEPSGVTIFCAGSRLAAKSSRIGGLSA